MFFADIVGIIAFSIYCFIEFHSQEQYSLDYINHIYDMEHAEQGIYDPNKEFEFSYDLYSDIYFFDKRDELSENFFLLDKSSREIIPRNQNVTKKIKDCELV